MSCPASYSRCACSCLAENEKKVPLPLLHYFGSEATLVSGQSRGAAPEGERERDRFSLRFPEFTCLSSLETTDRATVVRDHRQTDSGVPFRKAAGNWGDVNRRPKEPALLGRAAGAWAHAGIAGRRAETEANVVSPLQPHLLSLSLPPSLSLLSSPVLLLSLLILSSSEALLLSGFLDAS